VTSGVPAGGAWRWDERLGVLGSYYAAAEVALVGGTLAPHGGHNPLEPAARGAAVIVGSHFESQADAVAALSAAGALRECRDGDALAAALRSWLGDEPAREQAGAAGLAVVAARQGAAARAVERLTGWSLWPAR
jgi:3-deoxy-D-manno-octulosonic-acid transferase